MLEFEASNFALLLSTVQVIAAFEEAVSGMALGGIRRCCIWFSEIALATLLGYDIFRVICSFQSSCLKRSAYTMLLVS